jgi:hypothetical protein
MAPPAHCGYALARGRPMAVCAAAAVADSGLGRQAAKAPVVDALTPLSHSAGKVLEMPFVLSIHPEETIPCCFLLCYSH